ncbi:MAG: ribonuclease R [Pseudomonadales bacterium]|nr:ribonuclease R [Pseudomonadales bacterium]
MAKKKQDSNISQAPAVHDPYADREAQNYENPIPSREYILEYMEKTGEPVGYPQLCEQLGLEDYEQMEALRRRLIAMSRDGQLVSNRRGVYGLPDRMELIKGRVQGGKDGFGFFIPNDGSGDLFLGPKEIQKVFDGDIVLARVSGLDRRGRKEGMIVEVLERRSNQIVGRYYWEQGFGVVVPDSRRNNQEILIPEGETRGASDGQFVVAEIITWPTSRRKPVAKIVEILGDHMTPGMEIDVAVRSHDIPYKWPREVTQSLQSFTREVPAEESASRIDLRQRHFVTIDGEDAKDFDDAVYCEALPNGEYKLLVAIADVSHYVQPGSALDLEAQNRGNSVYFPGHVIPMLPEALSNGLCSLRPEVDRLVLVCEMQMDARAQVTDYSFYEGVIHSHARLTYTEVAEMLEEQTSSTTQRSQQRLRKRYAKVLPDLENLYALYHKMAHARELAGALEFSSTETRIIFGETRKIREIVPVIRNDAHRLIEECMLAANVCTARFLAGSDLPVLYRVHEGPNMDKLDNLRAFLKELGLSLGRSGKPEPKDYQRVLQKTAERPDAHLIQVMLVRSMLQAVYQPENIGHFGLGFDAYTHFTSPIRRYPDLLVHRALRYLIRSQSQKQHVRKAPGTQPLAKKDIYPYQLADMQRFGEICSMTERRADAASYDVVDWLKCEYVQDRVGDEFLGTITSVTGFGLFVELNDIYVEGLVHITALKNDYYQFDPVRQQLRGERSGIIYYMGGTVRVKVVRVDLDERKIDLHMIDTAANGHQDQNQKAPSDKQPGKGRSKQKPGKNAQAGNSLRQKLAKGDIPSDAPPKAANTRRRKKPKAGSNATNKSPARR